MEKAKLRGNAPKNMLHNPKSMIARLKKKEPDENKNLKNNTDQKGTASQLRGVKGESKIQTQ